MMDEREDRLDEVIRDAARDYNAPPPAPRAEMWDAIRAARQGAARPVHGPAVIPAWRRSPLRLGLGMAALLALGVSIGRLSVRAGGTPPDSAAPPTLAATPGSQRDRGEIATRFATDDHLSRVETFLTEFGSMPDSSDLSAQARNLLGDTRLLLDSRRVTDPRTHKLLEDLELILTQIATLDPRLHAEERDFIADGIAQSHLQTRLRNAIPVGAAIRL